MSFRVKTVVTILLPAALAVTSMGQIQPVTSYKNIKYPPLRNVKPPEASRVELPNGIVLYLLEDHELPIISMAAMIHTGSRLEPADKAGLAGITGSVMRSGGSMSRKGDELDKELDRLGISVETGIGSDAGEATISALKEDFDRALPILADLMRNPAFPEDKIELTKQEMRDSIARRNEDPMGIAQREMRRILYGKNTGYGLQPEYATIDAIKREDLIAFHKQYFYPENIILGVWGDFKAPEMRAKIEKEFGNWAKTGKPKTAVPQVDPAARSRAGVYVIEKPDVTQAQVMFAALGGQRNDPDYYANLVLAEILGGGFSSRLVNNVRSKEGLAYATSANWIAQYDHPGIYMASAGTKSGTAMKALGLIRGELVKLGEAEPTDAEVELAKSSILKGAAFDYDSTDKVVMRMITYEYNGYPRDYLQKFHDNIEKVTKAQLLAAAKKNWNPDKMIVVVTGNTKEFDQPVASLGKVTMVDVTIPQPKGAETAASTPQTLAEGNQLLAKTREAMGGAKISGIKDYTAKGDLKVTTPQGEMAMKVEQSYKSPGKILSKMVTPMGEMVQGFDGQNAWAKTPGGVQVAPDSARKESEEEGFREPIALLSKPGLTAQALGPVKLGDKDLVGLLVTDPATKHEVKLYIDPKTNLLAGMGYTAAMMGPPAPLDELFMDYKDVSGVKFPSRIVVQQNGAKKVEITRSDIQVNTGIADSAFAKP